MPTSDERQSRKRDRGGYLFYRDEDGEKQDAELHQEILDQGDHDAAREISRRVMERHGLDPDILLPRSRKKRLEIARQESARLLARDWDESLHPRDEGGRFGHGGGGAAASEAASDSGSGVIHGDNDAEAKRFATERLITDGPTEGTSRVRVVRDRNDYIWGASHTGSSTITGHSAAVMGIPRYDDMRPTTQAKNLGNKFLDVIAEGRGAGEKLYHGFSNTKGIKFKAGDTIKLPLKAASGDLDEAAGYGISYTRSDEENSSASAFEFPAHTPMAGYSRWDRENTKNFGHTWSEAIVAGEFRVVGIRTEHETGWKQLPYTVVTVEPIGLFDRKANEWRKL